MPGPASYSSSPVLCRPPCYTVELASCYNYHMIYSVLVKPNSKAESVEIIDDSTIIVRTHKPAHDGEANADVIKILSKHFHTAKSNINIVKGQTSKHKLIEIML